VCIIIATSGDTVVVFAADIGSGSGSGSGSGCCGGMSHDGGGRSRGPIPAHDERTRMEYGMRIKRCKEGSTNTCHWLGGGGIDTPNVFVFCTLFY
jgi:hypothetical protein